MNKLNLKKEAVIWAALLAPFIYSLIIWNKLPDTVPTHWNMKGEVDDYSHKSVALLVMPLANVLVYFILFFIPRIDPRKKHYQLFGSTYQNIRLIIHIFFVGMYAFIMHATLMGETGGFNFMMAGLGLFFAFLGNYFRTVRSNWFVGIRTPWTLSNEEVWKKTHALGGRIWFYGGLIMAVSCMFLSEKAAGIMLFASVTVMALIPIVYSYFEYQKVTRKAH